MVAFLIIIGPLHLEKFYSKENFDILKHTSMQILVLKINTDKLHEL